MIDKLGKFSWGIQAIKSVNVQCDGRAMCRLQSVLKSPLTHPSLQHQQFYGPLLGDIREGRPSLIS